MKTTNLTYTDACRLVLTGGNDAVARRKGGKTLITKSYSHLNAIQSAFIQQEDFDADDWEIPGIVTLPQKEDMVSEPDDVAFDSERQVEKDYKRFIERPWNGSDDGQYVKLCLANWRVQADHHEERVTSLGAEVAALDAKVEKSLRRGEAALKRVTALENAGFPVGLSLNHSKEPPVEDMVSEPDDMKYCDPALGNPEHTRASMLDRIAALEKEGLSTVKEMRERCTNSYRQIIALETTVAALDAKIEAKEAWGKGSWPVGAKFTGTDYTVEGFEFVDWTLDPDTGGLTVAFKGLVISKASEKPPVEDRQKCSDCVTYQEPLHTCVSHWLSRDYPCDCGLFKRKAPDA